MSDNNPWRGRTPVPTNPALDGDGWLMGITEGDEVRVYEPRTEDEYQDVADIACLVRIGKDGEVGRFRGSDMTWSIPDGVGRMDDVWLGRGADIGAFHYINWVLRSMGLRLSLDGPYRDGEPVGCSVDCDTHECGWSGDWTAHWSDPEFRHEECTCRELGVYIRCRVVSNETNE